MLSFLIVNGDHKLMKAEGPTSLKYSNMVQL